MEIQRLPNSTSIKDALELHGRCCSNEPSVCNAAFRQLGQYLLRIAYSQIKSQPHLAHVAEDCSQQALITIWKKLGDGNGPEHAEWFMSWCASIVIHKILDELRKVARTHVISLEEQSTYDQVTPTQLHSTIILVPDRYALDVENKIEFVGLIQNHPKLSSEAKFVLLHGYLLELDDEELAKQLGKTRSTIRVLRFRGLKVLRNDQEFMTQVASFTFAEPA